MKKITEKELAELNREKKTLVATAIKTKIAELGTEIVQRNAYMDKRDDILYDSEAIFDGMLINSGFDKTKYNFLPRAHEIHTFQSMGRGFTLLTQYDKDDTSLYEVGTPEYKIAVMKNTKKATQAASARALAWGTIEDNGGKSIFMNMASTASAYGVGILKKYRDGDEIKVVSIESPQNFVAGWSDTNFRDRDFDAITYKISADTADRKYGKLLSEGQSFTSTPTIGDTDEPQTRPMVDVTEFVGRIPAINGGETFCALVVGDYLVGYETRKKFFPKYYIFQNRTKLRRPWGESDISDEAIDLNKTFIQLMSDCVTLLKKMFPKIKAKGFEDINLPQSIPGEIQVFPMNFDQDMDIMQFQPGTYPYKQMLDEVKESLFRVLGLGRVMIDDPTVSFESNQALMTGMKSTIDIAEDKQTRWKNTLIELFEDILEDLKEDKKIKDIIGDDYSIDIEWPSVLRKDDASYDTMLLNKVRGGLMSIETYLQKIGIPDVPEEIERIKSNMQDPVLGAILSANLRTVNQLALQASAQPQPQAPTNAPMTTDQNQGTQPMSQPGSGAPGVSPEGAMATMNQNNGQ